MKEMTIEQKAKAYDEAIVKIQKYVKDEQGCTRFKPEEIFPELKESKGGIKDEMIRKAVISTFKPHCDFYEVSVDEALAWFEKQFSKSRQKDIDDAYLKGVCDAKRELEKQDEQKPINIVTILDDYFANTPKEQQDKDWEELKHLNNLGWELVEQKPTDKVEPKFNVGDWVATNLNNVVQIKAIEGSEYVLENRMRFSVDFVDRCWRKWTIQDAKNGDVVIDKSGSRECPFIFKETKPSDIKTDMLNPLAVLGYCGIGGAGFTKGSGWGDTANCIYYPATKEQRDTLMEAMADAGYTFDFEKKELKKIEQKSEENPKNNWERVTKEVYFKEPVLVRRKDKSDSWEGYRVCNNYTLDPQTDECYIRIKDINNQKHWKPNQAEIDFLNMIAGCMNKTLNEPEKAELKRIIKCLKNL